MVKLVALKVLLILVITIAIAWLGLALVSLFDANDPVAAFVDGAPRMLFGVMGIALALWALLVIIGAIVNRHRSARWRIATHLVTLIVSIGVNVLIFTVLAFADSGGWGLLLVGIALAAGIVVAVAGIIAVLLVELVILRDRKAPVEAATSAM